MRKRKIGALLLPLLAAGCAGVRPAPPPLLPAGEAGSGPAVRRELDARLDGLRTIHAGLELVWEDPRFEDPERCRCSLSFAAPRSIRLRGVSAAFFTVFDLVADDDRVWLDIPREDLMVFGSRRDPAWEDLPLSPRSLMIALLAHPCPGGECLDSARVHRAVDDDSLLVLSGDFGELAVESSTGIPRRFVSSGADPFRIEWTEWTERSGIAWPQELRIERSGGERLRVSFGRVQVGRTVSESRFDVEPDQTREILTPQEAARKWAERRF